MANTCPKCNTENPDTVKFCGECGTQLPSIDDIEVTETIETPNEELTRGTTFAGRYEIIEELGKGGMGRVYRVEDIKTKEEIALKLIKAEFAADKKTIERFRNELTSARKITHKNVCRMYDLGEEKGLHFITMEYISGQDLKGLIRQTGQLTVGKAISIAKQICDGLAEAHSLGVIHRDLKPNNIMIDRSGNAKIMDFGIARAVKGKSITGSGVMIGTPEYMSPEQVEAKNIDHRSDIYSLGVIIYEMLTGRLPFEGETPLAVAMKHKGEIPKDPKEFNSQISDDLSSAILRCLEKDKENRFQNVREVRVELDKIEQGIPTSDRVTPLNKSLTSKEITVSFNKRWLLISVLFVVLAATVLALLFLRKERPTTPSLRQNRLVVLPFENLGLPEDDYFAVGITDEIASRLSALHELNVISRSSAIFYKKTEKTIREIGEELGVDYVIDGTVRWDRSSEGKGRVRVTPELIRVSDDIRVWSDRYDREIEDIFSVQSSIAEQIIRELGITLLDSDQRILNIKPTDNLDAYQAYLKGIDHIMKVDLREEGLRLAAQMFERATELDPNFALAYVRLAQALSILVHHRYDLTEETISKAKAAAERALELQPTLPEGHMALGMYYYLCHKDYDQALEELSIAEKGLPNNSDIIAYMGYNRRRQGDLEEAASYLKKALELNPKDASIAYDLGQTCTYLRRYQEAEHYYNRSISLAPDQTLPYYWKSENYIKQGLLENARITLGEMPKTDQESIRAWHFQLGTVEVYERNFQKALEHAFSAADESDTERQLGAGLIYMFMNEPELARGYFDSARILLEKIVKKRPDSASVHSGLGYAYAGLSRKEEAIREGELASELYPISKDAFSGPDYVYHLAEIYVMVGEYEKAIDKIEYLLSIPSRISVPILRLDPTWDPLREHPRFKQILEKYSEKQE
jgi:serine/threonine protein kinase/tetratricopeptide (TPR) repeat protein